MDVKTINLNTFPDDRGFLTVGELGKDFDFPIKRFYYIYGVPGQVRRGFHAHKELRQLMICLHGSCMIDFDDGSEKITIKLDSPKTAIYVGPGIWREMYDFKDDAVLLVQTSEKYNENDYIRDYNCFLKAARD